MSFQIKVPNFWPFIRTCVRPLNHVKLSQKLMLGQIFEKMPVLRSVTFADSYLTVNIEFWKKACTLGKYYSYTGMYLACSHLYMCTGIYTLCHVLAVALANLP